MQMSLYCEDKRRACREHMYTKQLAAVNRYLSCQSKAFKAIHYSQDFVLNEYFKSYETAAAQT